MNHMNPKDPTLYDAQALPFYGSINFSANNDRRSDAQIKAGQMNQII